MLSSVWFSLLLALVLPPSSSAKSARSILAFVVSSRNPKIPWWQEQKQRHHHDERRIVLRDSETKVGTALLSFVRSTNSLKATTRIEYYEHDVYDKLSYHHLPASPGNQQPPILLVHPVGIGLAAWFWERMMDTAAENPKSSHPDIYAVNLIGCGLRDGSNPLKLDEKGIHFPLGWVKGCETLLQEEILPKSKNQQCMVIVQGGLATIGILLADRNANTIDRLILTSPPSWKEVTTPIPGKELERNYMFWTSPLIENFVFPFFENRSIIKFFSDLFLFAKTPGTDERWLDRATREACAEARPPIQAFNAGLCDHRSFREELCRLQQPVLILQGGEDVRAGKGDRDAYAENMQQCIVQTVANAKNVLPWEAPELFWEAVQNFYN